jgi:succinoglycan biosynthesis transport protein ExoP
VEALLRESRELQRDALSLERAQVAIAAIERETAAHQELYVVLLTRLNEIAAQKEAMAPDARVLNAAVPPEVAAGPQRGLLAALAGVLGLMGFTAAVLVVDALSARFESLGALEEATGLTVLGAVGRRPEPMQSRRLVDRDIGQLPAEDGVELAIMLRGNGPLPRIVVLVPAERIADAEALALRIAASADRRDRGVKVVTLEAGGATDAGQGLFETMPLSVQMAVEQDGGARAAAQIRQGCGHCDAVLLILPPVAETAMIVAWARLADSTLVVVDGRRPERGPVMRTVARLRDIGVMPAGVVVVS